MADSKENYWWEQKKFKEQRHLCRVGLLPISTPFHRKPYSNLFEKYFYCLEMQGDVKNYIRFVVDNFSKPLHSQIFF